MAPIRGANGQLKRVIPGGNDHRYAVGLGINIASGADMRYRRLYSFRLCPLAEMFHRKTKFLQDDADFRGVGFKLGFV